MKLIKVEFTKEQLNNLLIFLNRVNLQGAEVGAFVEIMQVFGNPIEYEDSNKHIKQ